MPMANEENAKKKKKSFVLRLSPEMFEALEHWASDEFRSVNGQVEYILFGIERSRQGKKEIK